MREAAVFFKGEKAGVLTQLDDSSFRFQYDPSWVTDDRKPSISLTMPKKKEPYHSKFLFPFFFNKLPEGSNRQVVCKLNRIDKRDDFGLLLTTGGSDSIGAVTVRKIEEQ
jgi:HipA-like protein